MLFMRAAPAPIYLAMFLAFAGAVAAAEPAPSQIVVIAQVENAWEIAVPVAHATLVIPDSKFQVFEKHSHGATSSPRYFFLEDKTSGEKIIAGWLEPAKRIASEQQTLRTSWNSESAALAKSGMAPYSVEFGTIGSWTAITYEIANPAGSSVHIRASRIVADTWIDLHLSVTSTATPAESKAAVTKLLQSLTVRER